MRGRVIVVPGPAVRRYAEEPVERLRQAGYDADLRPGLSWRGLPVDIADYGRAPGAEISAAGEPVDVGGRTPNKLDRALEPADQRR
jgi:hypothetical protein